MTTTRQFTQKVKEILDNSTFTYQYSDYHGCDADKAQSYLNTQRFSTKAIEKQLNEERSTILDFAREQKVRRDELPRLAAEVITNSLCFDRIRRFLYNDQKHAPGRGWSISESVSWHIA